MAKKQSTIDNLAALNRVGGLSEPSKMPCYSYSIPASSCKLGSILAKIKGTTCSGCYANTRAYTWPVVRNAMERRLNTLTSPTWIDDMIKVISWKEKSKFFRWHDSGDLQGVWHLRNIVLVAIGLPDITFWLPTREASMIKAYLAEYGDFPVNLTVRVSATKIDSTIALLDLPTSGVSANMEQVNCNAVKQNNECRECRKCWSKSVPNIVYKKH